MFKKTALAMSLIIATIAIGCGSDDSGPPAKPLDASVLDGALPCNPLVKGIVGCPLPEGGVLSDTAKKPDAKSCGFSPSYCPPQGENWKCGSSTLTSLGICGSLENTCKFSTNEGEIWLECDSKGCRFDDSVPCAKHKQQ